MTTFLFVPPTGTSPIVKQLTKQWHSNVSIWIAGLLLMVCLIRTYQTQSARHPIFHESGGAGMVLALGGGDNCTAPNTLVNAGEEAATTKITGYSDAYGPYPGPYLGEFKGYRSRLFLTHRSGNLFEYIFDHKYYANGHVYLVTVGFAEAYQHVCHEGGRVFNVYVNRQLFVKHLDVYKESGGCKHAFVLTRAMTPDGGIFKISFEGKDHRAMVSLIDIKAVVPYECEN